MLQVYHPRVQPPLCYPPLLQALPTQTQCGGGGGTLRSEPRQTWPPVLTHCNCPFANRSPGQAPALRRGAPVRGPVPLGRGQVRAVRGQRPGGGGGSGGRLQELPAGGAEDPARGLPFLRGAPYGG